MKTIEIVSGIQNGKSWLQKKRTEDAAFKRRRLIKNTLWTFFYFLGVGVCITLYIYFY